MYVCFDKQTCKSFVRTEEEMKQLIYALDIPLYKKTVITAALLTLPEDECMKVGKKMLIINIGNFCASYQRESE